MFLNPYPFYIAYKKITDLAPSPTVFSNWLQNQGYGNPCMPPRKDYPRSLASSADSIDNVGKIMKRKKENGSRHKKEGRIPTYNNPTTTSFTDFGFGLARASCPKLLLLLPRESWRRRRRISACLQLLPPTKSSPSCCSAFMYAVATCVSSAAQLMPLVNSLHFDTLVAYAKYPTEKGIERRRKRDKKCSIEIRCFFGRNPFHVLDISSLPPSSKSLLSLGLL